MNPIPATPLSAKAQPLAFRSLSSIMVISVLFTASIVLGQSGSEDLSLFGYLGQGNAAVNGSQAVKNNSCVPTATANGLSYLENYVLGLGNPDPFTMSPNSYVNGVNPLQTAMGTTANGTPITGMMNGMQSYLSPTGNNPAPSVSISGQISPSTPANWLGGGFNAGMNILNTTPTVSFLANALNAHSAVEITIQWGTFSGANFSANGAHELTLDSISYDSGLNSGTIGFIDPWGTGINNAGSDATTINATFSIINGFMYVTYPITVSGPDDTLTDNGTTLVGSNGETGRILDDAVENVPDVVSTSLLLGVSFLGLAGLRWKFANQIIADRPSASR